MHRHYHLLLLGDCGCFSMQLDHRYMVETQDLATKALAVEGEDSDHGNLPTVHASHGTHGGSVLLAML